jgi:hypothetical protein
MKTIWAKHQLEIDLFKKALALKSARISATKEMREENNLIRSKKFHELRKQGKRLEEIALAEGITRERVRQILLAGGYAPVRLPRKTEHKKCFVCGLPTTHWLPVASAAMVRHKNCSKYNGGSRNYWRKKRIELWADKTSSFHVEHKERMRKYWFKVKADPVRYAELKEKQKIHVKKYHDKKKALKLLSNAA